MRGAVTPAPPRRYWSFGSRLVIRDLGYQEPILCRSRLRVAGVRVVFAEWHLYTVLPWPARWLFSCP